MGSTDNKSIQDQLHEISRQLQEISNAFPDGPIAHRQAHEAMIRAAKAQEDFWNEMKLDLAKKGAWGLLVIILGLVLTGLSVKLGIWR